MSRGPGQIERRIAELFAVTRDRALSISDRRVMPAPPG
jgi:hypothetical protein